MNLKEKTKIETLTDVRKAIKEADRLRFQSTTQTSDVILLENTIHDLRNVERALVKRDEKFLTQSIKKASTTLKEYSGHVRTAVTKFNSSAKVLDVIEKVLKRFAQVLLEINLWGKYNICN